MVKKAKSLSKTKTKKRKSEFSSEAFCIKYFKKHHLQVPFPVCPRTRTHPTVILGVGQCARISCSSGQFHTGSRKGGWTHGVEKRNSEPHACLHS